MAIIPWRPFWDIDRFFEEDWIDFFDRGFSRMSDLKTPRMDIYEDNGNLVAEVELPGVDPKNIEVEVKNNYLSVEAKKEEKKEEREKGYYRRELAKGYYKRVVPLPVEVVGEKAEAEYKEGVLKILIPKQKVEKKEEKKGIKIKVK